MIFQPIHDKEFHGPRFRTLAVLFLSLLFTGCESLPQTMRASRDLPPLTRDYEAPAESVMAAAPHGLHRMGFNISHSSSAHGLIEAISDVRRDGGMKNSKQIRMKMTVMDLDGGGARASLQLWEMREEENHRGERFASEIGIGSMALHSAVFDAIEAILKAPTE